jgi:DNA-binding CsgD family transcriptional regulator
VRDDRRIQRAVRGAERLPAPDAADPEPFYAALLDLVADSGVRFVGACWHLTDPATGLFTWVGAAGELPGDFAVAVENELLADDVAKFADLWRRRAPVATLVDETGGRPERSARFREHYAPDGFADELRVVFKDPFGRWGSLNLFGDVPFEAGDRAAAAALAPVVARALRAAVARGVQADDVGPPGVLVLDADDHVRARDARADELLGADGREDGGVPGIVHVLAARARLEGGPVSARTLGGGAWTSLDASPVVDGDGAVAVVVRRAPAASALDARLRAEGLTEREREIALAIVRGDDTATIAATHHISPYTVQDHLKAIFEKTGERGRRDFVTRFALDAAVGAARRTAAP